MVVIQTYITAERPGKLMESVRREIHRIPEGETVPLFHNTFLSGGSGHVVCDDGQAKE
jgi:hypothetical protein